MGMILFIIALFLICVKGGQFLGKSLGNTMFPEERKDPYTFIDKSVHHHVHHHEHKHINIIDDTTKNQIMKLKDDE